MLIILGAVQGVTEFLPISSSGHLLLLQDRMEINEDNVLIVVVLHAGSLCSIILYYWKDLIALLKRENWRVIGLIAAGTAPAVLLVKPIKFFIDALEGDKTLALYVSAAGFLGSFLFLTFLYKKTAEKSELHSVSFLDAVLIGLMQLVALTPGVSRSGSTISMAGRRGISPAVAARFSFFLGLAAISGAMVMKTPDLITFLKTPAKTGQIGFFALLIGFFVSFGIGYVSLIFLIRVLKRGKMIYFGVYCLIMAVVAVTTALRSSHEPEAKNDHKKATGSHPHQYNRAVADPARSGRQ